ncbi:hypothetical protein V1527DRAFT_480541 [Lipomyces starkeyi]
MDRVAHGCGPCPTGAREKLMAHRSRIAETLTWKTEKAAFARAQLIGLPDPTPPNYVAPATLDDLLQTVVNPMTVPFQIGSSSLTIDPRLTDLDVGVPAELTRPRLTDGRLDVEARDAWHDSAYQNSARKMHLILQGQALDRGIDVHTMATTIPTSKTQVAQYLHHARVSLSASPILFEHYKYERPLRWKTYRREQKVLHGNCMRIKGNKQAKKEDVYLAGQFGSTMNGKRAAPVKKLHKHLLRYVTVVPVDEYRTFRVCSKHNEEHRERTGLGEEEDEGGGTRSTAEADLIHIHGQRNANGDKGPSLHPVLFLYANSCN